MRNVLTAIMLLGMAASTFAKNLDRMNWIDQTAWNCVAVVAVRPFSVTGEFKGQKSQDEYMKYFVVRLSSALVRPGGVEKVFLVRKDETVTADAFLTGEFLELSAGNRAARFWVGFGAGTAKTEVHIQAYRSDERTPMFDLEHARVAPFSLSGDANMGDIEAVASDIGETLLRRRSQCNLSEVKALVPLASSITSSTTTDAEISIESSVANAEVYVDGKFVGNAPLP